MALLPRLRYSNGQNESVICTYTYALAVVTVSSGNVVRKLQAVSVPTSGVILEQTIAALLAI